jgi:hypothetical protein
MPTKPRRRRDPAKEKLWRRIIRRHQQSDLPVHAFCQNEGLKVGYGNDSRQNGPFDLNV